MVLNKLHSIYENYNIIFHEEKYDQDMFLTGFVRFTEE